MRLLLASIALLTFASPAQAAPLAKVRTTACDTTARSATFESDMRAIPRTTRMQVRFSLLALEGSRWARVKAPGFGEWQSSNPGIGRYVYTKTVEALPPGAYRVRVHFRWVDDAGDVLARRTRTSRTCRQPDPRPNLRAAVFAAAPRGFAVRVSNTGREDAGAFGVTVAVGGTAPRAYTVDGLGAGLAETWIFDEPCAGTIRVVVDSAGAVGERNEDDNVLEAPCPA